MKGRGGAFCKIVPQIFGAVCVLQGAVTEATWFNIP